MSTPGELLFEQPSEATLKLILSGRWKLEKDLPIRESSPGPSAARIIANYQLLTAKPLLIVLNIGEDRLSEASAIESDFNSRHAADKCRAVAMCGKLEMELAQMEEEEAEEFRGEYGLKESGLERTIRASYELSDLISFFTIASSEVRAWSIKQGTTAVKAAGKIHTDMEKGFIRAESIGFDDLVSCKDIASARQQGRLPVVVNRLNERDELLLVDRLGEESGGVVGVRLDDVLFAFGHREDDRKSFRMFTAQLCSRGTANPT